MPVIIRSRFVLTVFFIPSYVVHDDGVWPALLLLSICQFGIPAGPFAGLSKARSRYHRLSHNV